MTHYSHNVQLQPLYKKYHAAYYKRKIQMNDEILILQYSIVPVTSTPRGSVVKILSIQIFLQCGRPWVNLDIKGTNKMTELSPQIVLSPHPQEYVDQN